MAEPSKDTIYIDIDDEITAIIDKLQASQAKVVALVLPKRAATLQSIVNMKLLKRAADEANKNLVLVTTESGLMPLAGSVGLYVAATPTSKPSVPAAPKLLNDTEETVDETADLLNEADTADTMPDLSAIGNTPVGELAGSGAGADAQTAVHAPANSGIETLELDNADPAPTPLPISGSTRKAVPKVKKDRKLRVPNFNRFRLLLVLGVLVLVGAAVFGYLAVAVLPKAEIIIKTNASNVNTNIPLTLDTSKTKLDPNGEIVPAKSVQVQKTYTSSTPTTGQKNIGSVANGSVTMTAKKCSGNPFVSPDPVPSGSGISTNNLTYITQSKATFYGTGTDSSGCYTYAASSSIKIVAQNAGANYNVSSATFAVAGRSDVTATGSADGGTDSVVQVVSQTDIDTAKSKITTTDTTVESSLSDQLKGQGLYAITATYNAGTPSVTSDNQVGDQASSVTVTETITYTMLGVNQSDLKTLVDDNVSSQIDTTKQSILEDGISQSAFKNFVATSSGGTISLQTTALVGPDLNTTSIAKSAAGQKSGDVISSIKNDPGVTDVTVKLSPFWVTTVPKNTDKITVIVAKPTKTVNGG